MTPAITARKGCNHVQSQSSDPDRPGGRSAGTAVYHDRQGRGQLPHGGGSAWPEYRWGVQCGLHPRGGLGASGGDLQRVPVQGQADRRRRAPPDPHLREGRPEAQRLRRRGRRYADARRSGGCSAPRNSAEPHEREGQGQYGRSPRESGGGASYNRAQPAEDFDVDLGMGDDVPF